MNPKDYIPGQRQWQTVINKLYSVLPFTFEHPFSLNMGEGRVNSQYHRCGTIHCVGGWYTIAHYKDLVFDTGHPYDFNDGANAMAMDLGFYDNYYLSEWAGEHPELWGNENGGEMFFMARAYEWQGEWAVDFEQIIHHFERVKKRCYAYTNKNNYGTKFSKRK